MKQTKYSMFIQILEAGSFSAASEKLNYSQSAISQLVQSLEKEMGVPLLHRSKTGLTLTTEGERLLPMFYDIYHAESNLNDALFHTTNTLSGTVRIGAFPSISCHLLPQVIQSFQQKYPAVKYQILHGNYKEVENLIINGRVDLGFIRYPSIHQLDIFQFRPEPLIVIFSKDHPFAEKPYISATDLNHENFILQDDGYSNEIINYFEKNHVSPNITLTVRGNAALLGYVGSGMGISIITSPFIQLLPSHMLWKEITPPLYRSIAIACRDKSKLSRVNSLFYNEIISTGIKIIGRDNY